jgi:hypothetical protein
MSKLRKKPLCTTLKCAQHEKSAEIFFEFEINSRSSGRRLSYIKKMLTLSVTNRIIMKITVWLIPT